jgi:tetratricopeptide (TPR) repeat protein
MALSEIEKLERRYQENPQGLTFAPLAEAYRKSGDPQRAIGVLAPGLELHPDYIPASIVLGRCHLDLKDDAAAEQAFAHVLTLDTENVIALKALADITERGARFGDSSRWLEQLLVVDRSNDEAREQLERVRASHSQQATAEDGAAAPGAAAAADEALAVAPLDGLEQHSLDASDLADDAFGEELPPLETVERETSGAAAVEAPPVEAFEPTVAAEPEPTPYPVSDPSAVVLDDAILGVMQLGRSEEIVLSAAEHTEFQLPSASEVFSADAVPDGMRSEASEYQLPSASEDLSAAPSVDAASGGSEYQLPSASDELIPEAEAATGASEFQLPDASSDFGGSALSVGDTSATSNEYQSSDVAADLLSARSTEAELPPAVAAVFDADEDESTPPGEWVTWSDAALDADAEPFEAEAEEAEAEEVTPVDRLAVTEIMEIVSLATVSPVEADEPDLIVTESMAELFLKQGHPADALRVYRELLARRPGDSRLADYVASLEASEPAAPAPLPPYAASSSGGTSVRELMRTVLGSRPNGLEPSRQAASALGANGPEAPGTPTRPASDHLTLSAIFGEDAAPLPPMSRKPRTEGAPPAERGGVSFDEFYGGPAQPGSTPRPAGTPQVAGGEDDLDQFHDWLQNLKR